jgi:MerR family transcriptional regulator, copper efflux regulator
MPTGLQIGKVSERTGLSIDAIRFYEKQRLLDRPPRTEGGFRLFSAQDIERIHFIRRAQQLGFSLPEIRELLVLRRDDGEACSHVLDLLRGKVTTVRNKIRELGVLGAIDEEPAQVRAPTESLRRFTQGMLPSDRGNCAARIQ